MQSPILRQSGLKVKVMVLFSSLFYGRAKTMNLRSLQGRFAVIFWILLAHNYIRVSRAIEGICREPARFTKKKKPDLLGDEIRFLIGLGFELNSI